MKKIKKLFATIAVASVMMTSFSLSASALTHSYSNCGATTTVQVCGTYRTTYHDSHYLHTNTYCQRSAIVCEHYRACAGCGANNGASGTKICTRSHEYCPTELNLCK